MTPSPESKTIPVDFPVANLQIILGITKKGRLELLQRRLVPGTFQKIFQAFSFYVLLDSYLLLSKAQDISLVKLSREKRHASRAVPCHPSDRQHRVKLGI